MRIILPCLPDPTDVVIQGEQIIPSASPVYDAPLALIPIVAGDDPLDDLYGFPVPRAMIGQSDWYGTLPRQIGPMPISGGKVIMLDIGTPLFVSPNIDPIQKWLNAPFPIDMTGMWFDLSADMLGAFEATNAMVFPVVEPLGTPAVMIPRGAIARSGLIKINTAPVPSSQLGQHMMEVFTDSTQKWMITGVTRDSGGATLGSCRVLLLKSSKILYNPDILANPVMAETTSDASGNFSFQVVDAGPFELMAYKSGSPDVAGVTINTVTAVVV